VSLLGSNHEKVLVYFMSMFAAPTVAKEVINFSNYHTLNRSHHFHKFFLLTRQRKMSSSGYMFLRAVELNNHGVNAYINRSPREAIRAFNQSLELLTASLSKENVFDEEDLSNILNETQFVMGQASIKALASRTLVNTRSPFPVDPYCLQNGGLNRPTFAAATVLHNIALLKEYENENSKSLHLFQMAYDLLPASTEKIEAKFSTLTSFVTVSIILNFGRKLQLQKMVKYARALYYDAYYLLLTMPRTGLMHAEVMGLLGHIHLAERRLELATYYYDESIKLYNMYASRNSRILGVTLVAAAA